MTTTDPIHACDLCGGTRGRLPANGRHVLCDQRRQAGLPTPCIGHRCLPCDGSGVVTAPTPARYGDMRHISEVLDGFVEALLSSPVPCPCCNGAGALPGVSYNQTKAN